MANKHDKEHGKLEKTTNMSGQLEHMEHVDILKMPMKGKVQFPYNQPYDRHELSTVLHDQTDRAAIARYVMNDIEAWIQKKLSGREYTWSIFDDKGERKYGGIYIDRENKGDEYAVSVLIPEIEAAIEHIS